MRADKIPYNPPPKKKLENNFYNGNQKCRMANIKQQPL